MGGKGSGPRTGVGYQCCETHIRCVGNPKPSGKGWYTCSPTKGR